jgi:hypothetical protein
VCSSDLYAANPTESDANILLQISSNAPYGSRKSLEYALLIEMYSQLYLVMRVFHEEIIGYPFYGYEFFNETAKLYGFSSEDTENLKVVALAKYKIITGQIKSVKELGAVQKALTGLSLAGDVPMITIIGTGFLFFKTSWFFFIPGIGTLLGTASLGIAIASAIIKKNKNAAALSNQRQEMIAAEVKSYIVAITRLSLFSDMATDIDILQKRLSWLESL